MKINLLVLRCADIDRSKMFYEGLGLLLNEEKHGTGPRHYSSIVGEMVLELYPAGKRQTNGLRYGISLSNLEQTILKVTALGGTVVSEHPVVIQDPDGHTIELTSSD